jgi:hypothetical protein
LAVNTVNDHHNLLPDLWPLMPRQGTDKVRLEPRRNRNSSARRPAKKSVQRPATRSAQAIWPPVLVRNHHLWQNVPRVEDKRTPSQISRNGSHQTRDVAARVDDDQSVSPHQPYDRPHTSDDVRQAGYRSAKQSVFKPMPSHAGLSKLLLQSTARFQCSVCHLTRLEREQVASIASLREADQVGDSLGCQQARESTVPVGHE